MRKRFETFIESFVPLVAPAELRSKARLVVRVCLVSQPVILLAMAYYASTAMWGQLQRLSTSTLA